MRLLLAPALLAVLSCSPGSSPAEPGPEPAPMGPTALVVHPALFVNEDEPLRLLNDGDALDLWPATQGGHVALIGAQLEGVGGDTVAIRAKVRDPESGGLVAEESRTVVVRPVPGDPARKQTDIRTRSQVAHVPLCPNYEARSIVDLPYQIEIEVIELYTSPPRKGQAKLTLVPSCVPPITDSVPRCRCECEPDYVLGKCK